MCFSHANEGLKNKSNYINDGLFDGRLGGFGSGSSHGVDERAGRWRDGRGKGLDGQRAALRLLSGGNFALVRND